MLPMKSAIVIVDSHANRYENAGVKGVRKIGGERPYAFIQYCTLDMLTDCCGISVKNTELHKNRHPNENCNNVMRERTHSKETIDSYRILKDVVSNKDT